MSASELGVAAQRDRFDRRGVAARERAADLTRSVCGIGQDLQARLFTVEQLDTGGAIGSVGWGEGGGGDKPGFGLDRDMCFVAVPVGADALVHMAASGSTVEMTRSGATR